MPLHFETTSNYFARKEPSVVQSYFQRIQISGFFICGKIPEYCGKDGYDLTTKHCVRSDQKTWGNDDQNGGGVGRGNQRGKKSALNVKNNKKLRNPQKIKSSRIKSSRRKSIIKKKIKSSRRKSNHQEEK
jgi:hypothetical protein